MKTNNTKILLVCIFMFQLDNYIVYSDEVEKIKLIFAKIILMVTYNPRSSHL